MLLFLPDSRGIVTPSAQSFLHLTIYFIIVSSPETDKAFFSSASFPEGLSLLGDSQIKVFDSSAR